MKTVGVAELKAHLSENLKAVREGQTITVLDRKEPIARLVPVDGVAGGLVVRPARGSFQDALWRVEEGRVASQVSGADLAEAMGLERKERL